MAEIIIVGEKPKLEMLLASGMYRFVTNGDSRPVLEDFERHKAVYRINEDGELEYLLDYLAYDTMRFAENLREQFNIFWIDQSDLLDYNQLCVKEDIVYEEFLERVDALLEEMTGLEIKNRDRSQYLWNKMTSHQKARVLPKGYIKNYMFSRSGKHTQIDLLELFEDSRKGRTSFGIVSK